MENLNNYEIANEYFEKACLIYRQCKCLNSNEEFMIENGYLHQIAFCFHNARRFIKAKIKNDYKLSKNKKLVQYDNLKKDDYLNHLVFSKVLNELVTLS